MAYLYDLQNATTGIDALILQLTTGSFYWFVPLILLFVWEVVFGGGVSRQRIRTGKYLLLENNGKNKPLTGKVECYEW